MPVKLTQEVDRRVQRKFTSGEPYILIDRHLSAHLQVVVAHKCVGSILLLIGAVTFAIAGESGVKVHLREKIGTVGSIAPIGGLQLVKRHCGIHALHSRRDYRLFKGYESGI